MTRWLRRRSHLCFSRGSVRQPPPASTVGSLAVVVCSLLAVPAFAATQADSALIAEATTPLDTDRKAHATVFVDDADGRRRVLQVGTNGWICHLRVTTRSFTQCYEGEPRRFFMSVRRPDGQPVRDLRSTDLCLEQDGNTCTVMGLQPEAPKMTIALLVDNSDWATKALPSLRDGLRGFLDALPETHEVGLFTISGQVRRRAEFTTDRDELQEQADRIFADPGGAVLLEGLLETWNRRFDAEDAWPVFVLVVHDSLDPSHISERRYNAFLAELHARAATVHAVFLQSERIGQRVYTDPLNRPRISSTAGSRREVVDLTSRTGGSFRSLTVPTALPQKLAELAAELGADHERARDYYHVIYECEELGSGDEIQVRVDRPGATIRLLTDRKTEE